MMLIENKFELGQTVYLKTDNDQSERMVIGISVRPSGLLYELSFGSVCSWHYEMEISEEKNVLKTTSN